jgi:hypothetical protein
MTIKAIALIAAGLIAAGGVGSALADLDDSDKRDAALQELEARKDDSSDDVELVDDEDDRDPDRGGDSRGDRDAPTQDPQTGSGDQTGPGTGQTGGTGWEGDTDGDHNGGNEGTGGGENSYVAAAPAGGYGDDSGGYVAPSPAPAPPSDYSYDGGSGGSDG